MKLLIEGEQIIITRFSALSPYEQESIVKMVGLCKCEYNVELSPDVKTHLIVTGSDAKLYEFLVMLSGFSTLTTV